MIQCQLKLELTKAQEATLDQWLFCLTGVWNWVVRKIELDAKDKIYHSKFKLESLVKGHSQRLGIPHEVLKCTIFAAHGSWRRCFTKLAAKPKLKGNRNRLNYIPFSRTVKAPLGNRVTIAGLGSTKFHKQDIPEGKIKCGRLVRRASGWYFCLFVDAEPNAITRTASGQIGLDAGFKNLLTASNGEIIEHPRELEAVARRLAQAQRSGNRQLTARLQERIRNRRKDRNHKISRQLVSENVLIAFSKDPHVGVAKRFGKSVASSAHGELRSMLAYKSRSGGTTYVEPDCRNSTKRCSNCGSLSGPTGLSGLAVRRWTCGCGAEHDRDCNAAMNALIVGLGMSHERVREHSSGTRQVPGVHTLEGRVSPAREAGPARGKRSRT